MEFKGEKKLLRISGEKKLLGISGRKKNAWNFREKKNAWNFREKRSESKFALIIVLGIYSELLLLFGDNKIKLAGKPLRRYRRKIR